MSRKLATSINQELEAIAEVADRSSARQSWPIVVGGCPRSGTSLLRRVLNAHTRIHCGPEVKFFTDLHGDYVADPLRHIRFTSTARSLVSEAELLAVLGAAFVSLHEQARERVGKPRWADKCPENVLYCDEWQDLLGDRWLLVHAARNPLDTLASLKESRFPLTIPADLEDRIVLYRSYLERGLEFGRVHSDRYRVVVYEELVSSPEPVLRGLMSWAAETLEVTQLSFNVATHEPGLEDPKVGTTHEIHRASVGRWSTILSSEEASTIWSATADVWRQVDPDGRHFTPAL